MPNKDGTANALDGIKSILIALAFALLIVWAGTSLRHNALVMLVTPVCTGVGGWLIGHGYNKKISDWQLTGIMAGIGLVVGILLFISI